jgi:enediyne biosynthesis protein E4
MRPKPNRIQKDALILLSLFAAFQQEGCSRPVKTVAPSLDDTVALILEKIPAQEGKDDSVCWSTVRQMENFFSGTPIEPHAVLLKIKLIKWVLLSYWHKASIKSGLSPLTSKDLDQSLPESLRGMLHFDELSQGTHSNSPQQSVSLNQYHRATEHYRSLLSIIFDEAIVRSYRLKLRALSNEAIEQMAALSTFLTLDLLKKSVHEAQKRHRPKVDLDSMKSAFRRLIAEHNLKFEPSAETNTATFNHGELEKFRHLSIQIAQAKVEALQERNKQAWQEKGETATMHSLLNRLVDIPLSDTGYERLMINLGQFVRALARGYTPQRIDTASSPTRVFTDKSLLGKRRDFISVEDVANFFDQLFPVTYQSNSDVHLWRTINPAHRAKATRGEQQTSDIHPILLEHYFVDSVRDTSVHWRVLRNVWKEPATVVLDPFAAELTSERIAEYAAYLLHEANQQALSEKKLSIDGRTINAQHSVRWQFVVPQHLLAGAGGMEWDNDKKVLLSGYEREFFEDVSTEVGIKALVFQTDPSHLAKKGIYYYGSGVAVGDYDQDGLPDLFFPGQGGNRLYKNLGKQGFVDVTTDAKLWDPQYDVHHALFVDVDNDGLLDLFVGHYRTEPKLFKQLPDHSFVDISAKSGLMDIKEIAFASFFDMDLDGLLDFYAGRNQDRAKTRPSLDGQNGEPNRMFRNLGGGRFEPFFGGSITTDRGDSTGWSLAGISFDIQNDGYPDLFVANDFGQDRLYANLAGKKLREVGEQIGVFDRGAGMNASVVDINEDGYWDLYVTMIDMFNKNVSFVLPKHDSKIPLTDRLLSTTSYLSGNKLLVNDKGSAFHAAENTYIEPGQMGWCWGASFFDYENDGDQDLYVANGFRKSSLATNQPNQFLLNEKGRLFYTPDGHAATYRGNSRAAVAVDLRNSGKLDLVVTNFKSPPTILMNKVKTQHSWLKVKLRGVRSNRYGVGASVKVFTNDGAPKMRLVSCGSGYLSQDDTTLHFGLGDAPLIKRVEVVWPGNKKQVVNGPISANQTIEIKEAS